MNEIVEFIAKHKVVVICRGLYDNELIKTIRALYDGGIRVVEVTFDQADPDAVEKTCGAIRTIKEHFPQMKVGSGTVTCVKHVLATKKAGGEFCLSPPYSHPVTGRILPLPSLWQAHALHRLLCRFPPSSVENAL